MSKKPKVVGMKAEHLAIQSARYKRDRVNRWIKRSKKK